MLSDNFGNWSYQPIAMAKSAEELDFSKFSLRARWRLRDFTSEEAIKVARDYAYTVRFGGEKRQAWLDELTETLDRQGYIRSDIRPQTFLIGKFYKLVNTLTGGKTDKPIYRAYYQLNTNEKYENCQYVSGIFSCGLILRIDDILGAREGRMLRKYYGLEDGEPWSYGQVARSFAMNGGAVEARRAIRVAMQKLAEAGVPELEYLPQI